MSKVMLLLEHGDALELRDASTRYDDLLDETHPATETLDAALDRDREELEARITAVVHREYERRRKQGITICSPSSDAEVEQWRPLTRAVLALLEGADDE